MPDPQQTHLLDYLYVLIRWRRLIIMGTLLAAVGAAGISLMLPERFTARTILLPPAEEPKGLGLSLLAGGGSGLPASLAGLVGMSTPSERLLTILDSRTLLGMAVDRFELMRLYSVPHREYAIELLSENVEHELGRDGSLAIETTAPTPELAADLTTTLATYLDSLNRVYRRRQATFMRYFLEQRVQVTRQELAGTASQMRSFQQEHAVVDIEAQTQAAVEVVKGVVQELTLRQVELGVASRSLAQDHPERLRLNLEVAELEGQLGSLVGDMSVDVASAASTALGPPLRQLPDLMHEYAELSLSLRVHEEILGFLTGKLEESKYREALDTPTLQVLDRATPPKTRSAPKRAMLTLACTAGALVLTTLLAFMLESWQRQREAQDGRMSAIREAWER
jgi:uncharacterized protein involved in exopolysaccharide biosynthesis